MKKKKSKTGLLRYILIGGFIVLIAGVALVAWFGYHTMLVPVSAPMAPSVATRSKIPTMPPQMKTTKPENRLAAAVEPSTGSEAITSQAPPQTAASQGAPLVTQEALEQPAPEQPASALTDTVSEPEEQADDKRAVAAGPSDAGQKAQSPPQPEPDEAVKPLAAAPETSQEAPQASAAPAPPQTQDLAAANEEQTPQPPAVPPAEETAASQVEAEAAPAPEPAKTVAHPKKTTFFTIQVGAYLNKAYAEAKHAELDRKGYEPYIYKALDKQERTWHMVRIGRFQDRPAAEQFISDFTARENMTAIIALSKKH